MTTLWHELLEPQPIAPFQPTQAEFDKAWDWIFRESGNPPMALKIVRNHARKIRARAALVGVYRRFKSSEESEAKSKVKVPVRGK